MNRDIKEQVKVNIMIEMRNHLNQTELNILNNVLSKTLSGVEIVEVSNLPSTADNVNDEILRMFDWKKRPKLSQKTADYYVDTIKKLIDYTHKSLLKMTTMDIEMYLESLQNNNSAVSINNNRRNISAFFTWMRKSHMILENPCEPIEYYKEIHKTIDHMLPEEFEQLKQGCKNKRDRAMIEFMRSTAMRVGEIVNIKISDVDFRTGKVKVYGEKNRTYRTVCLDSVALKYIQEYLFSRSTDLADSEYLFISLINNCSLTTGGVRLAINRIKEHANIKRKIYPHLFRKTTASNVIKRGGTIHDVGEYLGHKDRSTAGRYYAYISEEHIVNIFNKYVALV